MTTLTASYVVFVLIASMALVQGMFVAAFVRLLWLPRRRNAFDSCPKAAVILSVRGPDPFLEANMAALLDQDYSDFTLFIIVDSAEDSAWPYVNRVQRLALDRIVTMVLKEPLATCSLKCSSLAEVVEQLDESYEVVAFLDGDAPPYRTWLRDLVEPLGDVGIGVTTGNRWYTPKRSDWGSLVRYFWNAGAVVQVWLNGITWAGSMAMRRSVILEIGLMEAWRKALSVDATVVRQMRAHGYKTRFVPTVIMANQEEISLSSFIPWAERQMVAAKSSGSGWSIILLHATSIAACIIGPLVILLFGVVQSDARVVWLGFGAMAAYWLGAIISTLVIERSMQRVFRINEVQSPWINGRVAFRFLPGIVLSHLVYFRTLWGACSKSRVSWRGIEYDILGINDVRMVAYYPYQVVAKRDEIAESVV